MKGGELAHIYGGLYCYACNNPVRYTDPDGREADEETKNKINNLGKDKKRPLSIDVIKIYKDSGWSYLASAQESIEKNTELKQKKDSSDWYITSESIIETDEKVIIPEQSLTEAYWYSLFGGENPKARPYTEQTKRNTVTYKSNFRDPYTGDVSEEYFDKYLDANGDGYIDFYKFNDGD